MDPEKPSEHVQVRGHVSERRDVRADADIDHLAQKYLGEERYPFRQPGEERVTIVIEPERITGAGGGRRRRAGRGGVRRGGR